MNKFPIEGKLYFTKNGMGKVVPFNEGYIIDYSTRNTVTKRVPIHISETHTGGVYWAGGVSRKRQDIKDTRIEAEKISY